MTHAVTTAAAELHRLIIDQTAELEQLRKRDAEREAAHQRLQIKYQALQKRLRTVIEVAGGIEDDDSENVTKLRQAFPLKTGR